MPIDQKLTEAANIAAAAAPLMDQFVNGDENTMIQGRNGSYPSQAKAAKDAQAEIIGKLEPTVTSINEHADHVTREADRAQSYVQGVADEGARQIESIQSESAQQVEAVNTAGSNQVQAVSDAGNTQTEAVNTAGDTQVQSVNSAGVTQVQAVTDKGSEQTEAVTTEGANQIGLVKTAGNDQVSRVESTGNTQTGRVTGEGNTQNARVIEQGDTQTARAAVQADRAAAESSKAQGHREFVEGFANRFGDIDQAITETTEQADRATEQAALSAQNNVESAGHADRSEAAADRADLISGIENAQEALRLAVVPTPDFHLPLVNDLTIAQGKGAPYQIDVSPAQDGSVMVDLPITKANFTRASTKEYFNKSGLMVEAAINEPAFSNKGFLTEGGSTNQLSHSVFDANNLGWYFYGSSERLTYNAAIAPDGTEKALHFHSTPQEVIDGKLPSGHLGTVTTTYKANTTYTASVFIKSPDNSDDLIRIRDSNGQGIYFRLQTLEVESFDSGSYSFERYPDDWLRVCLTWTNTEERTISKGFWFWQDSWTISMAGLYLWGWQLEESKHPTSYISTYGVAVTRAPEHLQVPAMNNIPNFSVTGITLVMRFNLTPTDGVYGQLFQNNYFQCLVYPDRLKFYPAQGYSFDIPCTENTDYLAVFHYDPATETASVYLNGKLAGSRVFAGGFGNKQTGFPDRDLFIGSVDSWGSIISSCNGYIRDVKIWHLPFTPEQIANL